MRERSASQSQARIAGITGRPIIWRIQSSRRLKGRVCQRYVQMIDVWLTCACKLSSSDDGAGHPAASRGDRTVEEDAAFALGEWEIQPAARSSATIARAAFDFSLAASFSGGGE
jgi:hypothetical protein